MTAEPNRARRSHPHDRGGWIGNSARTRGTGRGAARALAALCLAAGLAPSPSADAAGVCGNHGAIVERLENRHRETRQALGLSSDGAVFEVLVAPDGGWTLLVTHPEKGTCIVAVGKAWQTFDLTGDGA